MPIRKSSTGKSGANTKLIRGIRSASPVRCSSVECSHAPKRADAEHPFPGSSMLSSVMNKAFVSVAISLFLILATPISSDSHDGELDRYGCHPDKERRDYHCHNGVLKGGSFDSKMEMVQKLRQQFNNLGRPWPYGDLIEEDITSPNPYLKERP